MWVTTAIIAMTFRDEDFELTSIMRDQIKGFALQNPDEETCGFILNNKDVVFCDNTYYCTLLDDKGVPELQEIVDRLQIRDLEISDDTEDLNEIRQQISRKTSFRIDTKQRLTFEHKGIAAVWHTHCLDSSPGILTWEDDLAKGITSDVTQAKLQRLPYILWHTKFDEWDMYDPCSINLYPLKRKIQRRKDAEEYTKIPYCWNRSDCFEIPRVALWGMFGIDLKIHLRSQPHEYLAEGWQRYVEGLPEHGFQEVPLYDTIRFKAGDCLLLQLPGYKCLHHLALCVDEKNQRMLHVFDGRVSEIEHIAKWRRYIRVLYRHQQFL